jgi:plastocyanin
MKPLDRGEQGIRSSLFTVLALAIFAGGAHAGTVRGTISVPPPQGGNDYAPNPYPGRASSLPGANHPPYGHVTDAVIYVEGLNEAVASALKGNPSGKVLAQKDQAFSVRVLPCAVGTTVDFPNMDPIFHNVFSVSPTKRFDLGKYPKGHSRQVTFRKPGLVPVFCDIHPSMACFILVLSNRAFTQPDSSGAYALPDLPAGTYQIKIWHPDFEEATRTVQVPETGEVTLDVSL